LDTRRWRRAGAAWVCGTRSIMSPAAAAAAAAAGRSLVAIIQTNKQTTCWGWIGHLGFFDY